MFAKKLLTAVFALSISAASFAANELAANAIKIKSPDIQEKYVSNDSTEVFMELINRGKESYELVAATTPVAQQIQIHATVQQHGHMSMEQVDGITIEPRNEEDLENGGLHLMLIGLNRQLIKNQLIPITLIFNDGSWKNVNARVIQ
jgi:copper(I)-binding protein